DGKGHASHHDLTLPDSVFTSGGLLLRDCALGKLDAVRNRLTAQPELLFFKDYDRRSALHVSASEGKLDVVQLLLDLGANPNQSDRWGGSPLDDAQRQRYPDLAKLIRQRGGRTGVKDHGIALITAAANGAEAEVLQLLDDGARVESIDYDSRGPLHLAASEGHTEVVKLLVKRGADVSAEDRWSSTPLDEAERRGNEDCVSVLKEAGARNGKGRHAGSPAKSSTPKEASSLEAESKDIIMLDKIGAGAFGDIFKCRWRGTLVAAKKLKPRDTLEGEAATAVADFRQEIQFLADLRHPNICMLLGYSLTADHEMMISELMKCSLLDLFRTFAGTPFALKRTLRYSIQFAQGMAFLHTCKQPILHRDLKPANLLLDYHDTLKVSDFGLAKLRNPLPSDFNKPYRMTGETGSYRYMAPEVYRHEDYGKPVDVYSFSMILFYMLVGEPPWAELDGEQAAKLAATQGTRPTVPRDTPEALQSLLQATWAENPRMRPSFTAVLEQLESFHLKEFRISLEDMLAGKHGPAEPSCCTIM
ncbi:MAG: hypothetical protein SGPRY_001400, partial [Prymnesium sp.]